MCDELINSKIMKETNKGLIISDEEFIKLFNDGLSQAEICRQTGISAAQASRRCKKLNLDYCIFFWITI